MILEGLVTTINSTGTVNIAPMGPRVDAAMQRLVLRPFQTSATFQNLRERGEGVFHVTDDVLLLSRAAIEKIAPHEATAAAAVVNCPRLIDCCRWYEFRVRSLDTLAERAEIVVDVVFSGSLRDFFGFNRAKHACLEAAILATRIGVLPAAEISAEMARLAPWVEKTGGEQEVAAFALVKRFIDDAQCHQLS